MFLALASGVSPAAESADPQLTLEEPKIPMWNSSFEARGSLGYKDNVLLSHTGGEDGFFWSSGLEALVFRLPSRGWQFSAFLDATDARYFDTPSVDNEQAALVVAELAKDLGAGWKSGLGLNYMYQNQVFDYSSTYTNRDSIGKIRGHTIAPRWKGRKQWGAYWAEVELGATRQFLEAPLDDFWQLLPRFTLAHSLQKGTELAAVYQFSRLAYDTRQQVDSNGNSVPDTALALDTHTAELLVTHFWDEKKRWRTVTRAAFDANFDNGSGFFDFQHWRLVQEVRFRPPKWEVKAHARVGHYRYPEQPVSAEDGSRRQRIMLVIGARAERQFTRNLKGFAGYLWERSISNLDFDDYQANVANVGLAIAF